MKSKIKVYGIAILLVEAVGILSGLLSKGGAERYEESILKPTLSPPGIVFPIVWSILFFFMAIGIARVYLTQTTPARTNCMRIFAVQLIFNFFWSLIFFNLQNFGFAFIWLLILWVLIIVMIGLFHKVDPIAAYLQIPYLLWVTFAGYLNASVWWLNG